MPHRLPCPAPSGPGALSPPSPHRHVNRLNALMFFLVGLLGTTTGALLPEIMRKFAVTGTGVSVFVALWSGGVTLGSAATNGLVRRIEGPVLLRLQCLCAILALAVMGGTSHYGVYLGAYVVLAVACGTMITLGHTVAACHNPDGLASGLSVIELAVGLGYLSAPLFFATLSQLGHGWEHGLWLLCLLPAAMMGLQARLGIDFRAEPPAADDRTAAEAPLPRGWLYGFLALLMLGSIGIHYIEWGQNTWNTVYTMRALGVDGDTARVVFSVFLGGIVLSRFLNIFLSRRLRLPVLIGLNLGAIALAFALYSGAQGMVPSVLGNALFGLGLGALLPNIMAFTLENRLHLAARVSTLVIMGGGLGAFAGGFVLGLEMERGHLADLYSRSFAAALALVALAMAGLYLVRRRLGLRLAGGTPGATL